MRFLRLCDGNVDGTNLNLLKPVTSDRLPFDMMRFVQSRVNSFLFLSISLKLLSAPCSLTIDKLYSQWHTVDKIV